MAIDYKKMIKQAEARLDSPIVEALVLGVQGAGKSAVCGSFDVKTLYLHFSAEKHGAISAKTHGKSPIIAERIDGLKEDGTPRTADETFNYLVENLSDPKGIKEAGFGAVVVDGIYQLEACIRLTQRFKAACMTKDGGHNTFAENAAVNGMMNEVLSKLRALADAGIHYAATCIIDTTALGDDGEVLEATIRLPTYGVAISIPPQFGEVLLVGPMEKEGKSAHRFQFNVVISKVSKDAKGNVKKFSNFTPRITGVEKVPANMKASLAEVIKLKGGK